ncbi:MAG: cytidine/deoxycytidylate deaminase family protein [Thaumarchaeota archaeon]|nr:cytidine/deoxycytidylate deaminase family protein [Nitrososphaerota archaeon]
MVRPRWDKYFMEIAIQVSKRSTCDRRMVGAVIVRDKTILSTGYNGSIRGLSHCDEVGHLMEAGHCVRTIHAEVNAVAQAAKNGTSIQSGQLYTTSSPCWPCFKIMANSGIQKVYFGDFYRDERMLEYAQQSRIELIDMSQSSPDG